MAPFCFLLPLSTHAFTFVTTFMLSASGGLSQTTDELCMFSPAIALRNQALAANSTDEPSNSEPANQVRVEIFYESLCPYCHELLLESLKPMWEDEELRARLDLHFFPSGNVITLPTASVSEGYRFWHPELEEEGADEYVIVCQHGERECLGNAIQSCAMRLLAGPAVYVPFVFCMAEAAGDGALIEKASYECMQELGINAEEIAQCVRDPSTNAIMFDIANYSNHLTPEREYTPWVVVDGSHSAAADEGDLLGPVCAALGEPAPAACVAAANARGLTGVWDSVRGWLGVAQTSAEVKPVRVDGTSNAPGFSFRQKFNAAV